MSHVKEIESLLDRLIIKHIGDSSVASIENCKGSALRTISSIKPARTNQFEIYARLEGIVEKWRILNRDDLADTLSDRISELIEADWNLAPEVLSLLLLLSGRLAHQPGARDWAILESQANLQSVASPKEDLHALTDSDSELWKNVDFVHDGSDEDDDLESLSLEARDQEGRLITSSKENNEAAFQALLIEVPKADLTGLKDVYWHKQVNHRVGLEVDAEHLDQDETILTEVQAMREVIHMLLGLPTTIFKKNATDGIELSTRIVVSRVSPSSISKLFADFTHIGSELSAVREFVHQDQNIPLIQALQAHFNQCVRDVDTLLNATQIQIIDTRSIFVASLLQLHERVNQATRLIRLIIPTLKHIPRNSILRRPFSVLEGLYDIVCAMQAIGDAEGYEYATHIFFQCFQTYLKPINLWMKNGELDEHDNMMFIRRNDVEVPLHSLWQDQFSLLKDVSGSLHAPKFLHCRVKKILNTGKSINFLKRLESYGEELPTHHLKEPSMSFDTVCRRVDPYLLSPFPALFESTFDNWMSSQHTLTTSMLRRLLEADSGLQRSLDALEYLFFFKAGISSRKVLYPIFEGIDGAKRCWGDSFTLTELFEDAFRTISQVNTDNLSVRIHSSNSRRSMNALDDISVTYSLDWPVANIIRLANLATYQHIFTFLAQSHRAKFLLERLKLGPGFFQANRRSKHQVYSLRVRMLYFVSSLLNHISVMVVEVCTARMHDLMAKTEDIDAMVAVHTDFVHAIDDQCLLHKKHASLKQAMVALLDLVILLSDATASMDRRKKTTQGLRKRQHRESGEDSNGDGDAHSFVEASDEESDAGACDDPVSTELLEKKLDKINATFVQLYKYITASVRILSKDDNTACWEILATNLEAGEVS